MKYWIGVNCFETILERFCFGLQELKDRIAYKSFTAQLFGSWVYSIAVFAINFQTSETIAFAVMARLKYIQASITIGIEGRNIPMGYLVVMKMSSQGKNAWVGFVCKCLRLYQH